MDVTERPGSVEFIDSKYCTDVKNWRNVSVEEFSKMWIVIACDCSLFVANSTVPYLRSFRIISLRYITILLHYGSFAIITTVVRTYLIFFHKRFFSNSTLRYLHGTGTSTAPFIRYYRSIIFYLWIKIFYSRVIFFPTGTVRYSTGKNLFLTQYFFYTNELLRNHINICIIPYMYQYGFFFFFKRQA